MPTYEYVCDACQHAFDEFQGFNDKPLKKCPKCKKSKLRRLFGTGAALIFKGSGFYQTDYRSDSYKAGAKADTTPAAETKSSDTAKPAESAAGSKSETKSSKGTAKASKPSE